MFKEIRIFNLIDRDCNLKFMLVYLLCLKMLNFWRVINIVLRK